MPIRVKLIQPGHLAEADGHGPRCGDVARGDAGAAHGQRDANHRDRQAARKENQTQAKSDGKLAKLGCAVAQGPDGGDGLTIFARRTCKELDRLDV